MSAIGSQLTFCSPEKILQHVAVERNENGIVTEIYDLAYSSVETAQTLFFDGIISSEIVSLKQNISISKISEIGKQYCYLDFSNEIFISTKKPVNKPLIIDFGTSDLAEINIRIAQLTNFFTETSIFDIIAGCVYFPALVLGKKP